MTLTKGWYVVEHSPRKALTFWCRRTSAVLYILVWIMHFMMTPTNGNSFRVTDPLCGEFAGHRWIPLAKASDAEFWFFFICAWINGWLSKQSWGWWCETPSRSLWRHCYVIYSNFGIHIPRMNAYNDHLAWHIYHRLNFNTMSIG